MASVAAPTAQVSYATKPLPQAPNPIEGLPATPPMRTPDMNNEDPIARKAAEARQEAAKGRDGKQEKEFQTRARKKPEILGDANKHLADGEMDMRADLQAKELRLQQMEDQIAAANPADRDALVQQYNAAVLEHDADKQLVKSVAAAQVDEAPGRPTRDEAGNKAVALTGVQADLVRRLNDPHLNEGSEQFRQLSDRLVAVSSTIREMNDLVQNRDPGVRRKAGRLKQRLAARALGVRVITDTAGVDNYIDTVHNKSNWWNDFRRTAYRGPGVGNEADAASPVIDRAMREAEQQNARHEGARGDLRDTINSVFEAKRNAIYAEDAQAKARVAENAARVNTPARPVAENAHGTSPQEAAAIATSQTENTAATPAQAKAEAKADTQAVASAEQLTRRNQLLAEFSSIAGGKLNQEQLNKMVDVAMNNSDKDGKPASWGALLQMAMVLMSSLSQTEQAGTMPSEANPSQN